jgi:alkanesulfonate monooxygenase SsuD/methylene tetrahydromethanopterin reductase-like flavin-dependent oxidoreductase (luciferase family)
VLIDVQFSAAHNSWPVLRDTVLQAEADGFDTTWVFDHFDGSTLGGDHPVLECFTLLGALAAATTRIGLGSMVANVANRHPSLLAHAALSVQRVSNGRLHLGIGGGTAPGSPWAAEHERRGIPLQPKVALRQAAVADAISVIRTAVDVPIIVGVNSVSMATIAGRLADGVNVKLDHPRAGEFVDAARAAHDSAADRGHRPFETSGYTMGTQEAGGKRAAALGLDRLVVVHLARLS